MLAVFIALLKQELHTKADAQQRHPLRRPAADEVVQPRGAQLVRRIAESPHTGQHQPVCPGQLRRVAGDEGLRADGLKGGLQGKQVSHAVVDNPGHSRTPFVEGIASGADASSATAARSARATDLNAPSTM